MNLPCITVKEAIEALSKRPQDAKLHAWLPGSYLPVECVFEHTKDGKAMMEVNVPEDSGLGQP